LKPPVLPWRVRYKVAVGIAKALDYLHHGTSRPVIHRDVKASNILLTADFESQVLSLRCSLPLIKNAKDLQLDTIGDRTFTPTILKAPIDMDATSFGYSVLRGVTLWCLN